MKRYLATLTCAAALASLAACNNGGSSPVAPTPNQPTTDTFSGTLAAGATAAFAFNSTQAGEVDVVLTADATPAGGANIPLLVQLGNASADGSACSPQAGTGALLQLSTAPALPPLATQTAGVYCVSVTDYFTLGPVGFTITVTHH
jgi:hypothetical protein